MVSQETLQKGTILVDERTNLRFLAHTILPKQELSIGTKWISSAGNLVVISGLSPDNEWVTYQWVSEEVIHTHEKDWFAFQCRYCLVIDDK